TGHIDSQNRSLVANVAKVHSDVKIPFAYYILTVHPGIFEPRKPGETHRTIDRARTRQFPATARLKRLYMPRNHQVFMLCLIRDGSPNCVSSPLSRHAMHAFQSDRKRGAT